MHQLKFFFKSNLVANILSFKQNFQGLEMSNEHQLLNTSMLIRSFVVLCYIYGMHLFCNLQFCISDNALVQGGENNAKKVNLTGAVLHPFLAYVDLDNCTFMSVIGSS